MCIRDRSPTPQNEQDETSSENARVIPSGQVRSLLDIIQQKMTDSMNSKNLMVVKSMIKPPLSVKFAGCALISLFAGVADAIPKSALPITNTKDWDKRLKLFLEPSKISGSIQKGASLIESNKIILDNIREAQRFINLYNNAVFKENDHGPSDYARKIVDYTTYAIEYYETLHRYAGDSSNFNSIDVMKEGLDSQKRAAGGPNTASSFSRNLNLAANYASNASRSSNKGGTLSFAPLGSARGAGPQDLLQKYQTLNSRAAATANAANFNSVPRRETARSTLASNNAAVNTSTSVSRGLSNKSRSTSAIRHKSVTPRSNKKTLEQGTVYPQKPISAQLVNVEEDQCLDLERFLEKKLVDKGVGKVHMGPMSMREKEKAERDDFQEYVRQKLLKLKIDMMKTNYNPVGPEKVVKFLHASLDQCVFAGKQQRLKSLGNQARLWD
eukprot:TRINITY_DN4830_c0_g1_i10.p1 TRINITY_DN4830_c0_g1~~TRINITY_DN4830_c0_g1_i10.p1  ORF type:complete len:467 (+),score=123.57 TRINITY_DN4830_c0_g1_i10:80-1402(+)